MKFKKHNKNIVLIIFLLPVYAIWAQQKENTILEASRINSSIEIDGDLDEDVWEEAAYATNFIQREPKNGQPATEQTRVAILYDANYLYIGVWAFDSEPDKITAKESKRDFSWSSEDNFEIILGPFDDNRNGYLFVVNPNGAMADVLITDEGSGFNKDWDGVWEAAVELDDEEGWFIEMAIPFSTLKFPEAEQQVWALNMERNIRRKNEQALWQGWSRDYDLEKISQAGKLAGLKNISGGNLWEIKPFFSGGVAKEKGHKLKEKLKVGGDINYLISPKMKFNLTLNTDFSQVESDKEEINLTRFELDFPEKRAFFLEGKNLFRFNLGHDAQTFYSRRIGLKNKKEIPISGGLRLTGKSGGTNLGLMSIQTRKKGSVPSTNYSVARVRQDVLDASNIGFILTSRSDSKTSNFLYGFDANYSTSELFGDKNFDMGIAFSQSITKDSSNAAALGYNAYISSQNDFVEFELSTSRITADFNPEIGFLRRKNYKLINSELQFNPRFESLTFARNLEFKPFEFSYYLNDQTNKVESFEYEFVPLAIEFKSGDVIEFNVKHFFDKPDSTFQIVDDVSIPEEEYQFTRYEVQIETFSGRDIFSELGYSWGDFYTGKRKEFEASVGWNFDKLNVITDWERNIITLNNSEFTTDELGTRFEFAFNTNLYTTLFTQWNNEDDEVLLDFRINWVPQSGSSFYFVVNQEYSSSGAISVMNTTILTKLNWLFSL